jgi:hypothetical protein
LLRHRPSRKIAFFRALGADCSRASAQDVLTMTMLIGACRHRGWLKWTMGRRPSAMAAFFVPWHNRAVQLTSRSPTSKARRSPPASSAAS